MTTYLVCYGLENPEQNYSKLSDDLQTYEAYCQLLESVWLITSEESPEEIRDRLKKHLKDDDQLFVSEASAPAAWTDNYVDKKSEWMRTYL